MGAWAGDRRLSHSQLRSIVMFGQRRNPFLGTDMPASYTVGLGDDIARRKDGGFDGAPMVNDGNPYLRQPQSMMAPQMEQPKPKGGGLFGKQSALWKVLGTLGDGLTGNPVYGQMQQQERQTLMQQERERQKAIDAQRAQMEERAYDQGEWDRRQQYERDNPKPANNDTANDLALYESWTPDQRRMFHEMNPTVSSRADGTPFVVNPYDLQQPTQQTATNPQTGEKLVLKDGQWVPMGGPVQQAPGGFPVKYDQFKRAIIQQESGGRYGVANGQGSGAMGLGQIMPDTAKALSKRLGLPYRPDLLSGNGQAARQYQDALTDAAVQEAWKAGGAGKDPRTSAQYYFGGSDRGKWGPKTKRYGQEVLGRIQ